MKSPTLKLLVSLGLGIVILILPGLAMAGRTVAGSPTLDPGSLIETQPTPLTHPEPQQGPPDPYLNQVKPKPRWSQPSQMRQPIAFLSSPAAGDPLDIALNYLRQQRHSLGLTESDLDEVIVKDRYITRHNGVTHLYLRQRFNGIEVFNGDININISQAGEVINLGNHFIPDLQSSVSGLQPTLSAAEAVQAATGHLGLTLITPLVPRRTIGGPANEVVFNDGGISLEDIPVKLMYLAHHGQTRLVWDLVVRLKTGLNWWDIRVDAVTGEVLEQNDWIANDAYRVFALPKEHPNDGPRTLVLQPANPLASPFGWHDTNGVAGAEFTDTRGNNVFAQDDINANNTGGFRPNGGDGLNFSQPLNLSLAPSTYLSASVTNLFYWNNILHDIHYQYGFDEASGNFQQNNYGRGGRSGDPVQADTQDGSGFNNANFATPPDAFDPRMQMFIFTSTSPNRDSSLDSGIIIHEYGHGVSNRLAGGPSNSGCLFDGQSAGMGEGWGDWWSLALTAVATDTGSLSRGVGTYVLGEPPNGPGIRPYPYSTNLAVNPLTYEDIGSLTLPHGVGTVWATTLWEMYWNLVQKYGFDPNFYTGNGGNNRAMRLVMDGLKFQPCEPTFLEARDAILLADLVNNNGANQCPIWRAFAKRGMGVNADDGGSVSTADVTEDFTVPHPCSGNLVLTKHATPSPAYVGNVISYTLVAMNYTTATLTGVTITDVVPLGTTYLPGSASHGGSQSGGIVQWTVGQMAPNAVATRTFGVVVSPQFNSQQLPLFFDDMENGGSNWVATGLWHLEDDSDPCGNSFSPTTSWYYGLSSDCTYDDGPNMGRLTMASPIALPLLGSINLTFQSWEETEDLSPYDYRRVLISPDGANFKRIFNSTNNQADWYEVSVDLSDYAGQNIWLRFEFDTLDQFDNSHIGWYVDDVRIVGQPGVNNTAYIRASQGQTATAKTATPVLARALLSYNPSLLNKSLLLSQVFTSTLVISNQGASPLVVSMIDRTLPPTCQLLGPTNPDFEQGEFNNWVTIDNNGTWLINEGTYPRLVDGQTMTPLEGTFSALADQLGPGTNILYQNIALPANLSGPIILSWQDQWENHASVFSNIQQFRVRLYGPGGSPLLGEPFRTQPSDPLVSASTRREVEVTDLVTAYAGQSVRLQFEVEAFVFYYNVQLDTVRLCQTVGAVWAATSPVSTTIPPFSQRSIKVIFDSRTLTQTGVYNAELLFSGNMANTPVTPLPLRLEVVSSKPKIYLPVIKK